MWLLGLAIAASAFGLEPQTVLTGLGLTSLALGFALKDVLSNFVSGLLILALRPFELGDRSLSVRRKARSSATSCGPPSYVPGGLGAKCGHLHLA